MDPAAIGPEEVQARRPARSRAIKWGISVVLVLVVFAAALSRPARELVLSVITWCATSGPAGVAVYGLLFTVSTVLVIPATLMTIAAGWAWGLWYGTLVVLAVSLVADWVPFAIARRLGRSRAEPGTDRGRLAQALEEAFERHGFTLVALLRLSPVAPYNVTNYLLGLTPVSTFTYLVASTIGSVPGVLVEVYLGSLIPRTSALHEVSAWGDPLALTVAVVTSLLALVGLTLIGRRVLQTMVDLTPVAASSPS